MGEMAPSPMRPIPPRPDAVTPPRPDLGWQLLPPTVGTPRRRRGLTAVVAVLTAIAVVGSLGIVGGVVSDLSRPRGTSSEYQFLATNHGEPVRWNPCAPIHYVVNVEHAPEGSLQDVQEAIDRSRSATGVDFVYDGPTEEIPQRDRNPYLPDLYGDRWAAVVIAWATQSRPTSPSRRAIVLRRGGSAPRPARRHAAVRQRWVVVNAADPNPTGWAYTGSQGPTVLHELGHIMGLDHVTSKAELMEPAGGFMTDFGREISPGLSSSASTRAASSRPSPEQSRVLPFAAGQRYDVAPAMVCTREAGVVAAMIPDRICGCSR